MTHCMPILLQAESLTKMLETVYDKSSSCSGISNILDSECDRIRQVV